MSKAITKEARNALIVKAYIAGDPVKTIAARFGISVNFK